MGDNATPKVPGRSLKHRMFLISFSPQSEKEHEIVVFLQPSEGKRHSPVCSCGLWAISRACIWPEQLLLGTALNQMSDLLCQSESDLNCQPWRLQMLQRMGNALTLGKCTHEKSLVLLSELRVILWLGVLGFLFIGASIPGFCMARELHTHAWDSQDSIKQLVFSHESNSTQKHPRLTAR